MPRTIKLDRRRLARIVQAVSAGNYDYVAAAHGGIATSTWHEYLHHGEGVIDEAIASGVLTDGQLRRAEAEHATAVEVAAAAAEDPVAAAEARAEVPHPIYAVLTEAGYDDADALRAELFMRVGVAQAEAEIRLVSGWMAMARDDWRAARDLLARRWPDRWRDTRGLELSGRVEDGSGLADLARAALASPEARSHAEALLAAIAPRNVAVDVLLDDLADGSDTFDDDDDTDA